MNNLLTINENTIATLIAQRDQEVSLLKTISANIELAMKESGFKTPFLTLATPLPEFMNQRVFMIDSTFWTKLFDATKVLEIFDASLFQDHGLIDNGHIDQFKAGNEIKPIQSFNKDNIDNFIWEFGGYTDGFAEKARIEISPFITENIVKVIEVDENVLGLVLDGEWIDQNYPKTQDSEFFINKKTKKVLFKLGFMVCGSLGLPFDQESLLKELNQTALDKEFGFSLGAYRNRISISKNRLVIYLNKDILAKISDVERHCKLINGLTEAS